MTNRRLLCTLIAALSVNCATAETWTYRGSLLDAGQPAQGRYDFRIALYTDPLAGRLAVPTQTLSGLAVKDGHFSAELDLDAKLLAHSELWLAVEVGDGQGGFVPLDARTRIDPKAVQATGCWDLQGNAGIDDPGNFLGTTDNQPLRFRAGNRTALQILPYPFGGGQPHLASPGTVINTNNPGIVALGGGSDPGVGHIATGIYASISGGATNEAKGNYAHVGGGSANKSLSTSTTVGGGSGNTAGSATPGFGFYATVAGGESNTASGGWAFVGGGEVNSASGAGAFIGSGFSNFATGVYAAIPSGRNNSAGDYSFAAGSYAKAVDSGSFVWADGSTATNFSTTVPNQFLIRAISGVGINAAPPDAGIELTVTSDADGIDYPNIWLKQRANNNGVLLSAGDGAGVNNAAFHIDHYSGLAQGRRLSLNNDGSVLIRSNITGAATGVTMAANGGSWSSVSDRRAKTAVIPVDPMQVLDQVIAMPMNTWSYIAQGESIRHMGPMAQDFAASFGLGENDTTISTVDADGVALAAIQGLNAKLESENAQLRARLEAIEARLMQ